MYNTDNLTITSSEDLEEKYNLFDTLISVTYANIFSLSKNTDIILKDFDYNCGVSRTFLEVACMVAYMTNKEIYLQSSIFDFVKARIKKKNKHIHWARKNKVLTRAIDIYEVAAHEVLAFNEKPEIFEEIFSVYYERNDN
jgi:hypothetical protein